MNKKKICFVINDLDLGGAEMMLLKLMTHLDKDKFDMSLVCLRGPGKLSGDFMSLSIPILYLTIQNPFFLLSAPFRLFHFFKKGKYDVVQTWLYHADFMGGIIAKLAGIPRIIWTLRNNKLDPKRSKFLTRLIAKLSALLSKKIPDTIICCATDVMRTHIALGYDASKMQIIYNGFDTDLFKKDDKIRNAFRAQYPQFSDKKWVGFLGRYHPDKGVEVFLQAAKLILDSHPDIVFALAGLGLSYENDLLEKFIADLGIKNNVLLLGPVTSHLFLPALDIFVSSSLSEGFSNAIGEAMSCEVPCVVTDVGDSGFLINNADYTVSTNNFCEVASGVISLLAKDQGALTHIGKTLNIRIREKFSVSSITLEYTAIFDL